jgi:N-acetylglucosaminyl-diphospho-decaprenol L-rhamnosyltransferase
MSESSSGAVAVIVVTWNSEDVIEGLVRSVLHSKFDGSIRLVVVDNDSRDGTVARVVALSQQIEVIQMGRNAGYAAGANAGIALARNCGAYLLVNPDLRLRENTLQLMLEEMTNSGAGIVVPRLVDEHGALRWSLRREPTVLRVWGEALLGGDRAGRYPILGEVEKRQAAYARRSPADWATGAAMLISQRCSSQVGSWDESFFLYSEEADFALRARDAGFSLRYTPLAEAVHFEGESHDSPHLFSLLVRNRVKLFRSRNGIVRTAGFWCGLVLGELIRAHRPTRRAALLALLGRTSCVAAP